MKNNIITIVMYHYVRPLAQTSYPSIKGLDASGFKRQVAYLKNNFTPITLSDCINALEGRVELPDNALLMTFDDGYTDHFDYAMPVLNEYDMSGVFFAPVNAIRERKILNVNKIHFVLAATESREGIINTIFQKIKSSENNNLLKCEDYYKKLAIPSRYDDKDTVFIKKILQRELPADLRDDIISDLFSSYVTSDEIAFAEQLYASEDQLKYMVRNGFSVGGHTVDHNWLDSQSLEEQKYEMEGSKQFLLDIGVKNEDLSFAYPFGGYNDDTLSLMNKLGFKVGFTTKVGKADIEQEGRYKLSRLNTNDFPA